MSVENDKSAKPNASPATDKNSAVHPSGYRGDNPSTAGSGETGVQSNTPENKQGHLSPSAPEDSNTTPGSTSEK